MPTPEGLHRPETRKITLPVFAWKLIEGMMRTNKLTQDEVIMALIATAVPKVERR